MKKKSTLLSFISLFCMVSFFLLCLKDGMQLKWWTYSGILASAGLTAGFTTLIYQKRITAVRGIIAAILLGFLLSDLKFQGIRAELKNIVNWLIPYINSYYRSDFYYESIVYPEAEFVFVVFLLAMSASLWMGAGIVAGKKIKMSMLPAVLGLLPGLLLGFSPGVFAVVMLIIGAAAFAAKPEKREKRAERNAKNIVMLCTLLAMGISLFLLKPISGQLLKHHKSMKEFQLSMEDKALEVFGGNGWFSSFYWLWGGFPKEAELTNEAPVLSGNEMFRITVEEKPEKSIYVKKFTGGSYDNGIWNAVSREDFTALARSQGAGDQDYARSVMEQFYDNTKKSETGLQKETLQNVTIQVKERKGNQGLMPYFSNVPPGAEFYGDGDVILNSREYTLQGALTKPALQSLDSLNVSVSDINGEQSPYAGYVEEQYLKIPPGQLSRLKSAVANGNFSNLMEDTCYSFDLAPVPEGWDIVEYFVFQQKKGYCMHYASAYTLMLRIVGIPARYASGYIVFPKDFKENGDGTYTAVVQEKRAHAWTEVYDRWFGWIPVEVTPPAYFNALEDAGEDTPLAETVEHVDRQMEEVQKQLHPERYQTEPEQPEKTQAKKEQTDNGKSKVKKEAENGTAAQRDVLYRIGKNSLTAAAIAAAFIMLIRLRRAVIQIIRRRKFHAKDRRTAVKQMTKETLRLLEAMGYPLKPNQNELEFADRVQRRLTCFLDREFMEFMKTARSAAYGNEEITAEQAGYIEYVYQKLQKHAKTASGKGKRIWWKYGRVLL